MKSVAIVIPVYNEGEKIFENITTIKNILDDAHINHNFILIDDGSKDNSWSELERLTQTYDNIKAIKLSRNFGKENALCAGLDAVDSDCCVTMDADLQHPPELIPKMYDLWLNKKFDVIEGKKSSRGKESFMQKFSAKLYYSSLKVLSKIDLNDASDFRLLDAKVIDAWKQMPEKQTFYRAMSTWVGFNRTQVEFEVQERNGGTTGWSIKSLFKLAITSITSFSSFPLYLSFIMGLIFLLFFIIMFIHTLYMNLSGQAQEGFTTVIILQLITCGLLLISNGIMGLYISKVYDEVKARPRYLIQQSIEHNNFKGEHNDD